MDDAQLWSHIDVRNGEQCAVKFFERSQAAPIDFIGGSRVGPDVATLLVKHQGRLRSLELEFPPGDQTLFQQLTGPADLLESLTIRGPGCEPDLAKLRVRSWPEGFLSCGTRLLRSVTCEADALWPKFVPAASQVVSFQLRGAECSWPITLDHQALQLLGTFHHLENLDISLNCKRTHGFAAMDTYKFPRLSTLHVEWPSGPLQNQSPELVVEFLSHMLFPISCRRSFDIRKRRAAHTLASIILPQQMIGQKPDQSPTTVHLFEHNTRPSKRVMKLQNDSEDCTIDFPHMDAEWPSSCMNMLGNWNVTSLHYSLSSFFGTPHEPADWRAHLASVPGLVNLSVGWQLSKSFIGSCLPPPGQATSNGPYLPLLALVTLNDWDVDRRLVLQWLQAGGWGAQERTVVFNRCTVTESAVEEWDAFAPSGIKISRAYT
ncbi:hypothetical protein FA95DRAFT_1614139 [Auriscalpium vulgare]|uniref:Uncharacterized protein n=1 Tax=Auriscalpium vulgare TaxID=40419 RepID=A0ACB8R0C2_9AGAM|nr:hypothetical protein FA95DRAFT_1614139 [Auriscalpium vulgare]